MEVQAQSHLLGLPKERLPVVVDEPGQTDLVVVGGEQDPLWPIVVGPLHLDERRLDVPEREHHHRDEPAGVGRAELGQPVVVGAHALCGERVVHLVQEDVAVEPEDVRIQQLVVDADLVHVGQPLLGVEGGGDGLLEVVGMRRRVLPPSGLRECADSEQLLRTHVPAVLFAALVESHLGNQVAPLRRHPGRPQVRRLDDVRVDVGHRIALTQGELGHRRSWSLLVGSRLNAPTTGARPG